MDPYHDKQSLSLSFSLCLINKLRHVCSWQSVRERERQSCREGEIKIPISPVTHIIRYTLCLLTDWHRARLDAAAASWKMLRVNLWQPKCDHVFEAGTFASALLIPPFFSLFFFFWGTSFPIQGNGVGVMNSCRGQTMSPLWPPVCKWNSQQSTGQEVILVYSLGTRLCREHSGRFSSPSFLNGTMQPLFFLQPFFFFLQSGSIRFHFSWQWNWGNPQRMSIPIIFCLLVGVCKQKKNRERAAESSWETDRRLVSLLCYLTNQAVQATLFPFNGIKSCEEEESGGGNIALSKQSAQICRRAMHIPKQH